MKSRIKKNIKKSLIYLGILKSNRIWPEISDRKKQFFIDNVNIKTSLETINDIKKSIIRKEVGAYLRFGDGDILLMLGFDDMLHERSIAISKEMKEAFKLNKNSVHKALAIHSRLYGFEKGMKNDMHLISDERATSYLSVAYRYIDINNIYTPVALHYLATYNQKACIDFLKFLKKNEPIFVGNESFKPNLIKKLFGETHIKTPSENSYSDMNRIENELITTLNNKGNDFQVVVIAMGCPGRILQKRILKKGFNVYLFDFGSLLDAFNGESTRLWIDLAGMDNLNTILDKL